MSDKYAVAGLEINGGPNLSAETLKKLASEMIEVRPLVSDPITIPTQAQMTKIRQAVKSGRP
jgi:hypothetical protein